MKEPAEGIIRAHLREVPLHRVIVRSAEALLLQEVDFARPMLDVGCGDGHFASVVFPRGVDVGIDPEVRDAAVAARRSAYRLVAGASSYSLPFPDASFASVLSNCVLEHIADLDRALEEISRVLRPRGLFVCTVIGEHFPEFLTSPRVWSRWGLGRARKAYVGWFNRKAVHHHFDSPERWSERFERTGLRVRRWRYYLSETATRAMHRSHYWSLPHLVLRRLTGRWVPFPGLFDRPSRIKRLLRYVDEPEPLRGSCIAFECERLDSAVK